MSFKSKTIGIIAGTALTLSIATGVVAAEETIVTLQNGDACAASVTSGSFNFGTWKWNGTTYVAQVMPYGQLEIGVTNSQFEYPACAVTVTPGDLEGTATDIPGADVILAKVSGTTSNSSPFTVTTPGQAALVLSATLNTDLDTYAPDTYQGDITVSAAGSAG